MKTLIVLLVPIVISFPAYAKDTISITGAIGEWQHKYHTEQFSIKSSSYVYDNFYAIAQYDVINHPYDEIKNGWWIGAGYEVGSVDFEFRGNEEFYHASTTYTGYVDRYIFKGSFYFGNRWETGFKQTGLRSSVGYQITDSFSAHAFYQVENATQTRVNDLYGLTLEWNY